MTERCWFLTLPERSQSKCAAISPNSLSMILMTVDGEITKTLFLSCWTVSSHSCSQTVEPHPSFLVTVWAFHDAPLIPSHDAITCFHLTRGDLLLFFESSSTFPVWCSPSPMFLKGVAGMNFRINVYFQGPNKATTLIVFVLFLNKYMSTED